MSVFSTNTSEIKSLLMQEGDFLSFSRQYPRELPCQPFSFEVVHQATKTKCNVTIVDTGVILFQPLNGQDQKDIILSSAIHGNETAPIEICQNIIALLLTGKLALVERVMFIFGNPESINIGKRFVEENMNRLFSGGHSLAQGQGKGLINQERKRAYLLEQHVRNFYHCSHKPNDKNTELRQRYHYDLHTAIRPSKCEKFAVYPFKHGQPYNKQQLAFLLACGVDTILFSNAATTTFSYFSSNEFNADAFTLELGKVMPFGENNLADFSKVSNTLKQLISRELPPLVEFSNDDFNLFNISQVILRQHNEFSFTFGDDIENFTTFNQGDVLAKDGDKLIKVKSDIEAIVFPNANVAIGQRSLLTLVSTKI